MAERDARDRSPIWEAGRRNGVKWAVEFVHAYALEMNDPSARAALNTCADNMGRAGQAPLNFAEPGSPEHEARRAALREKK